LSTYVPLTSSLLVVFQLTACASTHLDPRTPRDCDRGDGNACNTAGLQIARPPFANFPRAAGLYLRGCDLGSAPACANVANFFEAGVGFGYRDRPRAEMYYARSCRMGYAPACDEEARLRSVLDRTIYVR
jgi:TPR repeat protein